MKITVIRSAMFEGKSKDAMKPLIFGILSALTPPAWEITFYDDRIESLPDSIDGHILAISTDTFSARRAYRLAGRYRREGLLIVMGGFHPTVCPEEVLRYADVVLIGDAEDTWPQLLRDYARGCPKSRYDGTGGVHAPMLAAGLKDTPYTGKRYLRLGILQLSRGCKFRCDFCSIKTMYPGAVRQLLPESVAEEVRRTKERLIFFADDNLLLDEKSAMELFSVLKPLRKKWACQISMEAAANEALLTQMKESGCIMVLMGFESLNESALRQMNKQANLRIGAYEKAIRTIHSHGLMIYGTFVLGYDGDVAADVERTMNFALAHRLAVANFNPLIPMPGTDVYRRLKEEGRLLYNGTWWNCDTYRYGDTAYLPRGMTPDELRDSCRSARYAFYSPRSIIRRLTGLSLYRNPGRAFIYLTLNLVSAWEIRRKQGKILGGDACENNAHQT